MLLVRKLHPATGAPQGQFALFPPWRDPHPDPPPARERENERDAKGAIDAPFPLTIDTPPP